MSKCARGRVYKTIDSETGNYIEIYCRSTRHGKCYSEVWVRNATTGMFMFRARYLRISETFTLRYEGSRDNNIYIDAKTESDVNVGIFDESCVSEDPRGFMNRLMENIADRLTDLLIKNIEGLFGNQMPIDEAEIGQEVHALRQLTNPCGEFPNASVHIVWKHRKGGIGHERSGCATV